jgi:hypothetical protein
MKYGSSVSARRLGTNQNLLSGRHRRMSDTEIVDVRDNAKQSLDGSRPNFSSQDLSCSRQGQRRSQSSR